MKPKTPIRCAVVGVGYLGRFHAQKYKLLEAEPEKLCALVAVCDGDPARAQAVAAELGVEGLSDWLKLIGRVDAVTVAASTQAHYEIAKGFLESGVDVCVEKPMTATLAQAEDLVRVARERGRVLQVGHVERFNSALSAAKTKLGAPLFIECHRLAPFKPRGVDVDVVLDLMIHDLDVILSLVKSNVASVSAVGAPVLTSLADIANARVEFESGAVANITASRVSQNATRKFRVFQNKQYLSIDFGTGEVNLTALTGPIDQWKEGQIPLEFEAWNLGKADGLLEETRAFVRSAALGEPVAVTGDDGLVAMRLAERVRAEIYARLDKHRAPAG